MESRRFFTGVVALGLSASLLSPVADAAVIGPQDPATKLCAFYLSPAEYARLMNAARLHFSAPEKEYALDYQTFRQAFPELGKVEEDVYKRIREEEGREFLAPSNFARPDSLQHTYAVEAFTEAGLPASVAEWYLFKYSPQRTTPQASADDVLTYHYYELMGQYQVLGPGQRALFRPVTQATETPDIARELQTRFPGLSDAAATAWAQQYADTFFYTNLRRVKEYVTLRDRAEKLCAAGGDATLALPIPPNAVNTVVPPIPTLTTSTAPKPTPTTPATPTTQAPEPTATATTRPAAKPTTEPTPTTTTPETVEEKELTPLAIAGIVLGVLGAVLAGGTVIMQALNLGAFA
ncbi:hypothetical protein [Corynebacterium sp. HMSC08D02]|uniref:hypothetical protein n=1 Tax=Corynebacterium sp. HMSC08D02 TaxID=1581138 RepID=UPI000B1CA7EC|nr:hypothetical protein [Corynebacterium sp. HMSC08D02]